MLATETNRFTWRSALPLLGIASLIWLGLWLSNADQFTRSVMPKDISQPLFIMQNFSSAFMDENGQKTRSINAKLVKYFEGNETEMHSPVINLTATDGDRWFAQSDFASFDQANNALLTGNVIINKSDGHEILEIKTAKLIYNFTQKIGETNLPVTLQGDGLMITSTGIKFDLNVATIELKSAVKGQYEP